MSSIATKAVKFGAFTTEMTGWGAARTGRIDLDMVGGNVVSSAAMDVGFQGVGTAIRLVWRGAEILWLAAAEHPAIMLPLTPAAVAEELAQPVDADAPVDPPPPAPAAPARQNFGALPGVAVTDELRSLPEMLIRRMERSGIPFFREAGRRLRAGVGQEQLQVIYYDRSGTDPAARKGLPSWRYHAYYYGATRTIYLNVDNLMRTAQGALDDFWIAGVIGHESVHAMGGGEVEAFCGQGQFLVEGGYTFSGPAQRYKELFDVIQRGRITEIAYAIGELAGKSSEYGHGRLNYMGGTGPGLRGKLIDAWVVAQGGFARALNLNMPGFADTIGQTLRTRIVAAPPPLNPGSPP